MSAPVSAVAPIGSAQVRLRARLGLETGTLALTRIGDLLAEAEEDVSWLVSGILPTAGISLLAAKPKVGKSTLARCLALAVARGQSWLGRTTSPGPVIYLALEEKRAEVRRHFKQLGAGQDPVLVFCAATPADGLVQLVAAVNREKPALVIVDPLFRFVRVPDSNDYASVSTALAPLVSLARDSGAHLLLVHHLGKGERVGGDQVLGSTAIFAAVDTAILLKRTDRERTVSTIQRYGEADLEETVLTLDRDTGWVTAGLTRAAAEQEAIGAAILTYLGTVSEPVEERAIHDHVERGHKGERAKALRELHQAGRVTRTGEGKRGAPYLYSLSGSPLGLGTRNQKPESPSPALTISGSGPLEPAMDEEPPF